MAKKTATPAKAETKKSSKTSKGDKTPRTPKVKAAKKVVAPTGPFARLKAKYGTKDKLVDAIASNVAAAGDDAGALKDRLLKASNQQLLRMATVVETVKKAYGSRDKLIDALAKALNKAKDKDYLAQLGSMSLPHLYELARAAERKAKAARPATRAAK